MKNELTKAADGSITLTMSIPWNAIQKAYTEAVDAFVAEAELPGFRKGKAPRNIVEEKLNKQTVYEKALEKVIPEVYSKAVNEEKLHPIIMPKVSLKKAKEGEDWIVEAITCERPTLILGEYKKAIQDVKAEKSKNIWVPGQAEKPKEEKDLKPSIDDILRAVYSSITITIPAILLEQEVTRLLSDLVDQTKKLGLTVDQYLSSTGRTAETIRSEYEEQAKRTLTLEFSLEDIAEKENIVVSNEELEKIIATGKTEQEKKALQDQRYYLASILRRQKTIDHIATF